jgi:hypothetical protein
MTLVTQPALSGSCFLSQLEENAGSGRDRGCGSNI